MSHSSTRVFQPLRRASWVVAAVALVAARFPAHAAASDPCAAPAPPPGAASLGYVRLVFCVTPSVADISVSNTDTGSKLYRGKWYSTVAPPMSMFSKTNAGLDIQNNAGLMTETVKSKAGALPLLPASAGFYVEFAERLSDNDPDHFPAVWLMPQEHDLALSDHMAGDPAGFERWMELDVDEGGFNAGHHGAMIYWSGKSPNYQKVNHSNDARSTYGMDRTQEHVFGLSYDPVVKQVAWWVDGAAVGSVSSADVPDIVNTHHYFLLMNNQNHGLNHPYTMTVTHFSAWSHGELPKAPTGIKATAPK